jgi:hypothetical protein
MKPLLNVVNVRHQNFANGLIGLPKPCARRLVAELMAMLSRYGQLTGSLGEVN